MNKVWEGGKIKNKRKPWKEALLFDIPLWELSWWSRKTNKRWIFFFFSSSALSTLVCRRAVTACLVAPRSKEGFGNEHVQIEISIISCLITSQIAIVRQDKSAPSCFVSFGSGSSVLCLTEKVIQRVVLVNCVIQKWAITYTNMTQSSFWPKALYFPASVKQVIFTW